jgi:hypothetical protein
VNRSPSLPLSLSLCLPPALLYPPSPLILSVCASSVARVLALVLPQIEHAALRSSYTKSSSQRQAKPRTLNPLHFKIPQTPHPSSITPQPSTPNPNSVTPNPETWKLAAAFGTFGVYSLLAKYFLFAAEAGKCSALGV